MNPGSHRWDCQDSVLPERSLNGFIRVGLTMCASLPVCRDEQTFSVSACMSQMCQQATSNIQVVQKKKPPKAALSLLAELFTKASLGDCQFSDYRTARAAD
jgi:hypothetical protein